MQPSLLPFLLFLVLAGGKAEDISKSVVTLHPPWFRVLKDDFVSLRCEGSDTQDNSTKWFHKGMIMSVQTQDYDISFANIKHSGEYQCQRGQSAQSDPVKLEVFQERLLLQTSKLVYMEGESMMLRCHSWGNKSISKVVFFQNDKGRKYFQRNSIFSINQVNYNDSGNYYCSGFMGPHQHNSSLVRITVQGTNMDPNSSTSLSSKTWYYIPFYIMMGILFAVVTGLYFILKRKINNPKHTMNPITKWHKKSEDGFSLWKD